MHAYVHDLYKDIHRLQCISILLGGSSELGLAVACHGLRRRGPRGGHLRRREASIYIYIYMYYIIIYIYIYIYVSLSLYIYIYIYIYIYMYIYIYIYIYTSLQAESR